jgi:hypothetical protein
MDNVQSENFVILDLDDGWTRGLTDIYDPSVASLAGISLHTTFKRRYHQLLGSKDELISSLNNYSEEKAEELYWVWF